MKPICETLTTDNVCGTNKKLNRSMERTEYLMSKSIIFTHSYHHGNTQKIAEVIAAKFGAVVAPVNSNPLVEISEYDIIGFGAGIDGGKHYHELLEFAAKLPDAQNKRAFIFSTSATFSEKKMAADHRALRDLLQAKGFDIVGEFGCKGFTTRSIFNLVGGANKGRPNTADLKEAEDYARKLSQNINFSGDGKHDHESNA
jgi:flavodoxin